MELPRSQVRPYLALMGRPDDEPALRDRTDLSPYRVVLSGDGGLAAATSLKDYGHEWVMAPIGFRSPTALAPLLRDVLLQAEQRGLKRIGYRHTADRAPELSAVLEASGFVLTEDRQSYTAPLDTLPTDAGSPLSWESMESAGLAAASRALDACAQGALDWDEEDDGEECIRGYQADPTLYGGNDAVQIGTIEGNLAAFVCAQVDPRDGWSRITYMAVHPAYRGQGLGRWVQRKGFMMMREQGGKTYVGGTELANEPMRRLFEAHGCTPTNHVRGWTWRSTS